MVQLASAYGVHRDTVRGYLNDSQVERRRRSLTIDRQREAIEFYQAGRTLEEVADLIGTSKWTVQRVLRDHSLDRRPAARRLASPRD